MRKPRDCVFEMVFREGESVAESIAVTPPIGSTAFELAVDGFGQIGFELVHKSFPLPLGRQVVGINGRADSGSYYMVDVKIGGMWNIEPDLGLDSFLADEIEGIRIHQEVRWDA